jgi:D-3-phosphoglycerate dehydrogenase
LKVTILDDYLDTLRTLACFRELDGHDVTIWTDHTDDLDELAARHDTEALVLIAERTNRRCAARPPAAPPLIGQRSAYPHIDIDACTARRDRVVRLHQGSPSYATAELTWALVLARCGRSRNRSPAETRRGRSTSDAASSARPSGSTATGASAVVAGYGKRVRDEGAGVGAPRSRSEPRLTAARSLEQAGVLRDGDVVSVT